jgi:membrane protease YdiL (CAAX protease family)
MNKTGVIYILWIFLAWFLYVVFFYARVESLSHPISILANEAIRFVIFAAPAVWMIFYNKASCEQLGLISIQSKAIPSALVISILYIIIASCSAVFVQHKTFQIPATYSFWFRTFSIAVIIEEICFRGVLFFLFSKLNKKNIIIITSIAFSAIHFPGWYLFPIHSTISVGAIDAISIFMLGCILGWIYLKTRSIWATSFLHSINNLLAAGFGFGLV